MELGVDLLGSPGVAHGVLAHLQTRDGHAACVNGLGGSDHQTILLQVLKGLGGGRHVGDLHVVLGAVGHDVLGILDAHLVLGSAGHDHIHLLLPRTLACEELDTELIGVVLHLIAARSAHLQHVGDLLLGIDTVGIVDVAVGTRNGDDLTAQLGDLLDGTPSHVTEAGNCEGLALNVLAQVLQHLNGVVDSTVARCLGTDERTAECATLTGQHTLIAVDQSLVLTEHVSDLACANTQVTGGNVGVGADVAEQLGHEGLAEGHDLTVGAAAGIEVGAALTAAHGKAGQGVLEGLLEAQELDDGEVYGRMEAQAALVGADGAVELDTVAHVDLSLALVVHPRNTEHHDALGHGHTLQEGLAAVLGLVGIYHGTEGVKDFLDGLVELGLAGVLGNYFVDNLINVRHDISPFMYEI